MDEPKILPKLFMSREYWIKFSKYVIREYNGQLYIKPDDGARFEEYNPQDKIDKILIDFIAMAESILKKQADLDKAKEIIRFSNKYGLLGLHELWVHFYANRYSHMSKITAKKRCISLDKAIIKVNSIMNNKHNYKNKQEYTENLTNAFNELNNINENETKEVQQIVILKDHNPFEVILKKNFKSNNYYEWKYEDYATLFFPEKICQIPVFSGFAKEEEAFWRNYSEPLFAYEYLIFNACNSVYMWAVDTDEFEKGNYSLEDFYGHERHMRGILHKDIMNEVKQTWEDYFKNTIKLDSIKYEISFEDGFRKIHHSTSNLYDSICLKFIQDFVSKKQQIKQCSHPNCDNWFIPKSPNGKYCSSSCGNYVRVAKHRSLRNADKNTDKEKN